MGGSDEDVRLVEGRAEDALAALADASVDLIVADPPYYKVLMDEDWDRQWATEADYLAWLGGMLEEFRRVLKPNGSLYLFAGPRMAWAVEGEVRRRFEVLNHITWCKGNEHGHGQHTKQHKEDCRSYFPRTERILFAEQLGADSMAMGATGYEAKCEELRGFVFEPLRAYLAGEFAALGWKADDLNRICGTASMAGRHYTARSQWCLPTAEHYAKLQAAARAADAARLGREHGQLSREYEHLRREYEHLRREYEDLRRPFAVSADVPYTDVWDFPTVGAYPGKHPCEKPSAMAEHVVAASSRPGALVLDPFSGSGVVPEACRRLGRRCLAVEQDPEWCRRIRRRLDGLVPLPRAPRPARAGGGNGNARGRAATLPLFPEPEAAAGA